MTDRSTENPATESVALQEERQDDNPLTAPRERDIRLPLSVRVADGALTREVRLRRTTGWEEDLLRDQTGGDKARMGRVSQVLSQCTLAIGPKMRTADTGDDHKADQVLFFDEYQAMPSPSRAFAWVKLRQLSHGHVYKFGATCPHCKKHNEGITVDLRDLVVVEATDEFCAHETHIYSADGHTVEWKVIDGSDEYRMQQVKKSNPGNLESAELYPFIVKLDGKRVNSVIDLLSLSSEFRSGLRGEINVGGMDLVIVTKCRHQGCEREFQNMLPIYHPSFFSPGGK